MRRLVAAALLTLPLAIAGCGHKVATPPTAVRLPPAVEVVYPVARGVGVSFDTEIWAQFVQPLDSATVSSRNVSLNQDARLIPIQAWWESATRRVHVRPLAALGAGRTHTVTLGSGLASADGAALGEPFSWQFRTQAVSPPENPLPPSGTVDESPFVTLAWDSVKVGFGTVVYDVFVGPDSAVIANRGIPLLIRVTRPFYLPRTRWSLGTRFYWAVTVVNLTTRENRRGPVWRFETIAANAPIDSVVVPLGDWGHYDAFMNSQSCFGSSFLSGGTRYKSAFRWNLGAYRGRKLAGASAQIVVSPFSSRTSVVEVMPSRDYWPACDIRIDGFPHPDPDLFLISGVPGTIGVLNLTTDVMIAHLEATMRRNGFHGYVVRSPGVMEHQVSRMTLTLRMYR